MPTLAQKQDQAPQGSSTKRTKSNALAPATSHDADSFLQLHRTIGNQAVLQLLEAGADDFEAGSHTEIDPTTEVPSETATVIQPKLAVNTPGDIYEQEADHIAEQVMRMPEPKLQPACDCGGGCAKCQSRGHEGGPEHLQTKHVGSGGAEQTEAPPGVDEVLASPGQPLDVSARGFFEPRFGQDLSDVRIHADAKAAESAQSVNSVAYTAGKHIVLGKGQYAPSSTAGQRLLAHELTHVLQQSEQNQISPNSRSEPGMFPLTLQRQPDTRTAPPPAPQRAPAPAVRRVGLNRTLYVVQNGVWNKLPAEVRDNAVRQLNHLFAFVGAANTEKPFTIKMATAAQLPEQFDFSESVVSVIEGDPAAYVKQAFGRQEQQIKTFLAQRNVQITAAQQEARVSSDPGKIGSAGEGKNVIGSFAVPVMAGAVDINEVISSFLDNIDSFLEKALKKTPAKGKDPTKWPAEIKNGPAVLRPLAMLGEALGRAIAHEARHEYMGAGHSEEGLGESGAYIIGEKGNENFSGDDQAAILARIKALETQQGRATVVPTFPTASRSRPELFPF